MGMPATTSRETQHSNGMKNVTFISDKMIWDVIGGQQIDGRRWTRASVARTKTYGRRRGLDAGGRDNRDRETCAPVVDRGGGGLGCRWRGLNAGGRDKVFKDADDMDNRGKRCACVVPKKKLCCKETSCMCIIRKEKNRVHGHNKRKKRIFFPSKHKPCACG